MSIDDPNYLRYSKALCDLPKPAAFVDLEAFDENLKQLAARAKPLPIRVASKSVRCLTLIQRALAHPGFQGVLAYRGDEAVYLAKAGIDDIVIAYPVIDPREIREVLTQIELGSKIAFMVDRPEHLAALNATAEKTGFKSEVPFALDLDVSNRWPLLYFGVRRSWLSDPARLDSLLAEIKKYPRLKLTGVMGYEAQIAGVSDERSIVHWLKNRALNHVKHWRSEAVSRIQAAGHSLEFVNGGGTGSLESTRLDPSVTELAVGSGLYSPALFDHYQNFKHRPAAGFALEITRKPEENCVTCAFGGYSASGSIGPEKAPQVFLPKGLELLAHEGAGEVQTPLVGKAALKLQIGDLVFFRHAKAGEMCERFNLIHLIKGDQLTASVPTYRGEGKNFG